MNPAASILQAEGLSRRFGGEGPLARLSGRQPLMAVRQVDLVLRRGETLGLVGESGCGKSTLARLLVGLDRPSGGRIRLEGQEVHIGRMRHRVQYVFQDPVAALNPRHPVGRAIAAPLRRLRRMGRAARRRRMAALADAVGLVPDLLDRYPHELSGGQAQRVGIARALAAEPEVLVLDEPVSALDLSVQAQVLALLAGLKDRHGLTYLFISHDLAVVEAIADRVAVMYAGRIVEQGPADRVLRAPRHPYTDLLRQAAPRLDPGSGRPLLPAAEEVGEPPDPYDLPPGCAFAPRCPRASELCRRKRPVLEGSPPAACWHPLSHPGRPAA
ncbi:oligopeptide/dipeptide ABC transporter ATP-binding protein [Marinibaculum pumilum]|uniref:Oligopeptide/dipeptide ABC transporter ATP-binding protein n=1 Tax=Marinibaculum pumilum TaxID=1766165 RepID=A0ABV7L1D2_9PROT